MKARHGLLDGLRHGEKMAKQCVPRARNARGACRQWDLASGSLGVGKAPIALQALVAAVQQLLDLQVADLAIGIG